MFRLTPANWLLCALTAAALAVTAASNAPAQGRGAGPQRAATRAAPGHRSRARIPRHHRPQAHGPHARRQAHGHRRLPPQGHFEKIPHHLRAHSVQLQFLGRAQRYVSRSQRRARRHQARLCLRRNERARPLLLGRHLRHSRRPALGWQRCYYLDVEAVVVKRQSRNHRMLVHRRMAIGCRSAGKSGVRRHDSTGIRRGRRPRGALLRARQLVSRRCCANALHRLALR